MSESEAVKAAKKRISEGVETLNTALATEADEPIGLLAEYVLIYAVKNYDEDGELATRIGWTFSDDGSWHQSLGLVEYAKDRWLRRIATYEGDDD